MSVTHRADDQDARSRADIRGLNAQIAVIVDIVTVKRPTDFQRFVAFGHGARGLSESAFVEQISTKGYRDHIGRF